MITLTPDQLARAAKIAAQIAALEKARNEAEDSTVVLTLGAPSAQNPLGVDNPVRIIVPVHATSIRMALVDPLAPLYTELRGLGIELQL